MRIGDWLFSLELFDEGDWVPSFESLFFLEDFPESLPRESCACRFVSIILIHDPNTIHDIVAACSHNREEGVHLLLSG